MTDEKALWSNRWMWAALGAFLLLTVGFTYLERLLAPDGASPDPAVETAPVEFTPPVARKLDEETIEIDFGGSEEDRARFDRGGVDIDRLLRCVQEGIDREVQRREQDKVVDTMFRRMKRLPIRNAVEGVHRGCLRRLPSDTSADPGTDVSRFTTESAGLHAGGCTAR